MILELVTNSKGSEDKTGDEATTSGSGSIWIWIGVGIGVIILIAVAAVIIVILIWKVNEKRAQRAANKETDKSILIADIVDTIVAVDSDPGIAGAVVKPGTPEKHGAPGSGKASPIEHAK